MLLPGVLGDPLADNEASVRGYARAQAPQHRGGDPQPLASQRGPPPIRAGTPKSRYAGAHHGQRRERLDLYPHNLRPPQELQANCRDRGSTLFGLRLQDLPEL